MLDILLAGEPSALNDQAAAAVGGDPLLHLVASVHTPDELRQLSVLRELDLIVFTLPGPMTREQFLYWTPPGKWLEFWEDPADPNLIAYQTGSHKGLDSRPEFAMDIRRAAIGGPRLLTENGSLYPRAFVRHLDLKVIEEARRIGAMPPTPLTTDDSESTIQNSETWKRFKRWWNHRRVEF